MRMLRRLHIKTMLRRDSGASLVEYALLVALIAVACMTALVFFQEETNQSLSRTATSIHSSS